ncbi:MAG: hypothetical protein OXM01_09815 [Gemmatimonadota bacterium]|nr:hypothetical protein [Gemmatimonadota bacterium]
MKKALGLLAVGATLLLAGCGGAPTSVKKLSEWQRMKFQETAEMVKLIGDTNLDQKMAKHIQVHECLNSYIQGDNLYKKECRW